MFNANGTNENGVNKAEASVIISEIEKIVNKDNHGSIGVITLTKEQAIYIREELAKSNNQNVLNELVKVNPLTGEDISLFVKTIEDVQGEERDNIFITCS
jgi:primosomal replication protein N''